ncbi:MAG TPA: hypothetical protein VHS09_02020 [Polyangiaceae bacterium]|nr:hypothetical protein [Polyangiaceae bacterium]
MTSEAVFEKQAATVSLDRRVGDRWTVGGALGATTVGTLDAYGQSFALSPGPLVAFAASFRALDEGSVAPFVLLTASLGASLAWTSPGSQAMTAFDGRLGVAAGKTFAHVVTPYLLARAFGLPILWNAAGASVVGTDVYHYQLGAGLVVRAGRFDVAVEGVPLGERALVGSGGVAF